MLTSSFSIAEKEAKKLDKKKLPPVKHFFVGPPAQMLTERNVLLHSCLVNTLLNRVVNILAGGSTKIPEGLFLSRVFDSFLPMQKEQYLIKKTV